MAGSPIKTIWCDVTPGAGKSLLPLLASKLIDAGKSDKILWIAPRLSLLDQGEREFINPLWRKELGVTAKIRSSTNEVNPTRNLQGACTTYAAAGMDEGILLDEFKRHRYILVLDEAHHIALDSLWHQKIAPLWEAAAFRIPMTGTCRRGDGERIAFLPYRMNGCGLVPDLRETDDTAVIRYTRRDALKEKAIIPLSFHLHDGKASWMEDAGKERNVPSLDRMNEADASKAIYTALKTEFADELMNAGLSHWQEHRKAVRHAKCLVVCSDIAHAQKHMARLREMGAGARMDIATSSDSDAALKAISALKQDRLDVLVTVAMAYEGMSVDAISHIVCLTRVRSIPWIEQCVARSNRIDKAAGPYEGQMGHIFAPADPLFREIVKSIEAEQVAVLDEQAHGREERRSEGKGGGEFRLQPSPGGIKPLSSSMTDSHQIILDGGYDLDFRTPHEQEQEILRRIEHHIRIYSFNNRFNPKRLNSEIYAYFGKPRRDMTYKELEAVLRHIEGTYPMANIRGTGRPRVATKAVPVQVRWA